MIQEKGLGAVTLSIGPLGLESLASFSHLRGGINIQQLSYLKRLLEMQ